MCPPTVDPSVGGRVQVFGSFQRQSEVEKKYQYRQVLQFGYVHLENIEFMYLLLSEHAPCTSCVSIPGV